MAVVKLAKAEFNYVMPVSLVGATVTGKPNFLAVAWFSRVNYSPSHIAVALSKDHYTTRGIVEHGTFSINLPGADLVARADYVGIHSGKSMDKSAVFDVFYGELETAPMIASCAICAECRVVQTVDLPSDKLFIGVEVAAYADERLIADGEPDATRAAPFFLATPPTAYFALAGAFADAWRVGNGYKGGEK
jgi:flavin reductase (DIM6/NTAB) family NADH-FMN oxidoreductase RutF